MQTTKIPSEIVFRMMIKEEIINDLVNIYNIPKDIANNYLDNDTSSLLDKTLETMWNAQEQELENWIEGTDIRLHQKEE